MRHVILTGEVGAGKSTALEKALRLLDAQTEGIWTGTYESREERQKTLYMRAYGDAAKGCPFARMPGTDKGHAARCFDVIGVHLLRRARQCGELIVIDEMGWLERDASIYQQELRDTFDGSVPVLAVLRKNKAEWADWIRSRADVELITVDSKSWDCLHERIAEILRPQIFRKDVEGLKREKPICYELCAHEGD